MPDAYDILNKWYGWIASGQLDFTPAHLREAEKALSRPGFRPYKRPYACEDQNTCLCNGPAERGSGICRICHKMKRGAGTTLNQ